MMEKTPKTIMLSKYSKLKNYQIRMITGISTRAVYSVLQKNDGMK